MIDTIFFDVGNTLRVVIKDEAFSGAAESELMRLAGTDESREAFFNKLEARWKQYRRAAKGGGLDASEMELWSQHLLPDHPVDRICANAGRLTRLWRDRDGRRVARADVKDTLIELDRRGYTIGIIANTITETEIPDWMIADGVARYFKCVVLSSKVRIRKPDPAIYLLAARAAGKPPEHCAYIGDNPVRDVEGAYAAGFGMMVLINEPDTLMKEGAPSCAARGPDHIIAAISQILDIFPPLGA